MAALLDIDLEQVAQIVERGAGIAELALLLDRGRLGVALGHDQPAQGRAVLSRHLLPYRLAERVAETDPAIGHRVSEKDAPAIFRHLDHAITGPALLVDGGGGAQIDVRTGKCRRSHFLPPVEKMRLPMLERALQRAVVAEADIVRDPFPIVERHARSPVFRSVLYSFPVEACLAAAAIALQRATLADRIRPGKNPVLPGRKPPEDFRRHGLAAGEAQISLHAGQRVG